MIDLGESYLMMIEPALDVEKITIDDLTLMAERVFRSAWPSKHTYRGFHRCVCGAKSDSKDWTLPSGRVTNSLLVHYVRDHRSECPASELEKLKNETK